MELSMSKSDHVLAVEWKPTGVRSFLTLPHGGYFRYTFSITSAFRWDRESFIRWMTEDLRSQRLKDHITSWKVMSIEEAQKWFDSWPHKEDGTVWTGDIPYWES